ncbi:MAG: acetyl-CoA hydrolase/transferase family protein, partial [Pseudomonas sp.]
METIEKTARAAAADLDLDRWIRPGDTVLWGQAGAEPLTLVAAYLAQRHRFARTRAFLGLGHSGLQQAGHADAIDFVGYCGTGHRALVDAGVLEILPSHYCEFPDLFRRGNLRVDVLLLQVSGPDELGRYSYGQAMEYLPAALESTRVVIAEVNRRLPFVRGSSYLEASDIDLLVEADYPPWNQAVAPGPREQAVAAHVATLIEDGMTLQVGLGAIPDAVLAALSERRDLGLHSGAATEQVAALAEAGVLTNARKNLDCGVGVAGMLLGGERLMRYATCNPGFELRPTEYTHHPQVLGAIQRFAAVNSAVEVDLTGQVNAEVAAGRYVGAVGGAGGFLRAALHSR